MRNRFAMLLAIIMVVSGVNVMPFSANASVFVSNDVKISLDFESAYTSSENESFYSDSNAKNWTSKTNGRGSHAEFFTEADGNVALRLTYDGGDNYNANPGLRIFDPATGSYFIGEAGKTYAIQFSYKVERTDSKAMQLYIARCNRQTSVHGENIFGGTDLNITNTGCMSLDADRIETMPVGSITGATDTYETVFAFFKADGTTYPIIALITNNKTQASTTLDFASVLVDDICVSEMSFELDFENAEVMSGESVVGLYENEDGSAYYALSVAENWSSTNNGRGSHSEIATEEDGNTAIRLTYDGGENYNANPTLNIYNPVTKTKFTGEVGKRYVIAFDYKVERTDGQKLELHLTNCARVLGQYGEGVPAMNGTDMNLTNTSAMNTGLINDRLVVDNITEATTEYKTVSCVFEGVMENTKVIYPIIALETNDKKQAASNSNFASVLIDNVKVYEYPVPYATVKFVNYDENGDKLLTVDSTQTISSVAVPEREGYIFGGWYADIAYTEKLSSDALLSDYKTIYVKWGGTGAMGYPYIPVGANPLDSTKGSIHVDEAQVTETYDLDKVELVPSTVYYQTVGNSLRYGSKIFKSRDGSLVTGGNESVVYGGLGFHIPAASKSVLFYVEIPDYEKAGEEWALGIEDDSLKLAGGQQFDASAADNKFYYMADTWVEAPVEKDTGILALPSGYRGFVKIDLSKLAFKSGHRVTGETWLGTIGFKFNSIGGDAGDLLFGGIFYSTQNAPDGSLLSVGGKYYDISRPEAALVYPVSAADTVGDIGICDGGTAGVSSAESEAVSSSAFFSEGALGFTSNDGAKVSSEGFMHTYDAKELYLPMQPGVDSFMVYVEVPEHTSSLPSLKLLDPNISQNGASALAIFSNSVYEYLDINEGVRHEARAGADGELYAVPAGFKGYIKFDIKKFKNFEKISGIDFTKPYFIDNIKIAFNHFGGELGAFKIDAYYSVFRDSEGAKFETALTGDIMSIAVSENADRSYPVSGRNIFTDDFVSSKPEILYPVEAVSAHVKTIEADRSLNSAENAKAFADEINTSKVADYERVGDKMCHVSTFLYKDGNIYMSYYANTITAAEDPSYQVARFAYGPEDNPEKQVILDIQSVGDDLCGKRVTGVYDTILMQRDDDPDNIYILWTASIDYKYYRLYRTFNTKTETLGEIGVNRLKVGDITNDFSTSGIKNALKENGIGYKTMFSDIGIMQKLSSRIENGEKYYYTGAYSGDFTWIIKSRDLITWEYVAQPNEGANGTGFANKTKWENAVYVLGDKVYYFVRQIAPSDTVTDTTGEGSGYGILTYYDLLTGEWASPILVGDSQSRSDFIYYKGGLYLFHAPTDRNHIGILKIDTDDLKNTEVVLQADMKGSCFYPFIQYTSDGELAMSYTVNRQNIRLARFTLGNYVTVSEFEVKGSFKKASSESVKTYTMAKDGFDYSSAATVSLVEAGTDKVIAAFTEPLNGSSDTVDYSFHAPEGSYYIVIEKNGYVKYTSEVKDVTPDISTDFGNVVLTPGDIKGSYSDKVGDGIVDIDDFVRVLRGFAFDAADELRANVDINEDKSVSVDDLSYVKSSFSVTDN